MNEDFNEINSYISSFLANDKQDSKNFLLSLELKFKKNISYCYSYILKNSINLKLLDLTIREINKTKPKENLADLIDFILKQNNSNDFCNLKVLAIKVISNYKDTNSLPSLMYCLNNPNSNYKIRLASIEALGKIGDKNAFNSLEKIVEDKEEKSTYAKESAVVALGLLGDNRALDVFESIIDTKEMFMDKFSYLRERIIEAISKFDITKEKKALKLLKKSLLDNSPRVRISAIETLMNSQMDESYNLIYDRLKNDDDLEVQKNALIALYNISDRTILDEVIKSDYPNELKCEAINILKEYEEER